MKEEKIDSIAESSKTHDIHIGFPSFRRILVAYDGMQMSKRALSYAAYISKISDSEIVIVNVVEANRDLNNLLPITTEVDLERKEEQINISGKYRGLQLYDVLREVIEETTTVCKAAGVTKKILCEIRAGEPADEIINVSKLTNFDLIVMGSRRISSRIEVIGSTTRKVLTTVKIPLLIVQKQPRYKDEW